jgi:hypothetical protein
VHNKNIRLVHETHRLLESENNSRSLFVLGPVFDRSASWNRIEDAMRTRTFFSNFFLLNFLITNVQKYDPYTFIFDLGGSFGSLTKLFGALTFA